jgi:hypothetical protein
VVPPTEEVVLAMPTPIAPIRHARSTILLGSLATVREHGRGADYEARLSSAHREILVNLVAGVWVPIDVAYAHYDACEYLGFSVDQQVANGRSTFDKTSGTLLGTVIRMAKEAGVTPWNIIPQYQRFWSRAYDGNGVACFKLGPKEARVEVAQNRLCDSRYYRNALRGLLLGVTELFCAKAYVSERSGMRMPMGSSFRLQWA